MKSSLLFLKNILEIFQSYPANHRGSKYTKLMLPAILLIGIAVHSGGCAANKCDCPKFSGHRLGH